ncbi:MAG TPA: hypothetical protein VF138_05465 [Caulobacteraceae bacterium]
MRQAEGWIHHVNITRFRQALEAATSPRERRVLEALIEAELALLDGAGPALEEAPPQQPTHRR